ncbi:MAG: DNA-formamidopyrimidine glycosylase [Bacilli bacterium]|nr:DNA-formamidopyrimidine glycosylase [Bacilli bacterium]
MPELPEVETVRQTLRQFVLNKRIENVDILYPKIIENDVEEFVSKVSGQVIREIDRYGKYLIFQLDDCAFLSHLRMEGKYNIVSSNTPLDKHTHVVFHLDENIDLRYHDTRKFGRMKLCDRYIYKKQLPLSKLGKEPFEITTDELYQKLHSSSLPIKMALLDQTIMCGIGNIYANEICFMLGLHPHTRGSRLSKRRVDELRKVSIDVLNKAIAQGGTTIHSFDSNGITGLFQVQLNVHMKKSCPICKGLITKEMYKGRGLYYCKQCQKRRY